MYPKVDLNLRIFKRKFRQALLAIRAPNTPCDEKMYNMLTRAFGQLFPLLSSDYKYFESTYCEFADSMKIILMRCKNKTVLCKFLNLYKMHFMRLLSATYVEHQLKQYVMEIWIDALDKIPWAIKKKFLENLEENFIDLMQNTLQHIGNYNLQNFIVIIFMKYISLVEYNEKNILIEKIFTDKELLNFFKAIQTYEDESNIRHFINHYNAYRGLDNVFSIEAKHVSLMDINSNKRIELSANSRQFWIDFNKSSNSIDFWASIEESSGEDNLFHITFSMIIHHEIESSDHTSMLYLYLDDNIIPSNTRLENIGNFQAIIFTFPDKELFDYLLLQIIEPRIQITKSIPKKSTNYIDSTTEVELTDVYDIDDLLTEKPKQNKNLTINNAVEISDKYQKIPKPRENLIGDDNNKKASDDLLEIDKNIVENVPENMQSSLNSTSQTGVTEKKSIKVDNNNNKKVIQRKKKLTKNLPKKNNNIDSVKYSDSKSSWKSTEKSIDIIKPTENNISKRNQTAMETQGTIIKDTDLKSSFVKKCSQIPGKENIGTEDLYDGVYQSAKDRKEYEEITAAVNEFKKDNSNYPTHSYRAYQISSQDQNKKETTICKPSTVLPRRISLPRKTKPTLLYDHTPNSNYTEKNYDESTDSKISKRRRRQKNKKNVSTVQRKANIKSIKKNKDNNKSSIPDMRTVISKIRNPLKAINIVNNQYASNDKNINLCGFASRLDDPMNNDCRQSFTLVNDTANGQNSSLHVEDTSSQAIEKSNIPDMGNIISNNINPSENFDIQPAGTINIVNDHYGGNDKNINMCVAEPSFDDPNNKDCSPSSTLVNDTANGQNSSLHVEDISFQVNDQYSGFLASFDLNANKDISNNMLESTKLAPTLDIETTTTMNANEAKNIPKNAYFDFQNYDENATDIQIFNNDFNREWFVEYWFNNHNLDPQKESRKRKSNVERAMPKNRKLSSFAENLTSDSVTLPLTPHYKNSLKSGFTFPTERDTDHSTEELNKSSVFNKNILKPVQKIGNVEVTSAIVNNHNIKKISQYINPADIEEWQKGDKQKINDRTITKYTTTYGENLTLKFKNRYTGLVEKLQNTDVVKLTENTKEKFKKIDIVNAKLQPNLEADMQYQNSYKIEMMEYQKLNEKREELSKIILGLIEETAERDKLASIDAKQKIVELKYQLDERTEQVKRQIRKNYVDDFCDMARKILTKFNN